MRMAGSAGVKRTAGRLPNAKIFPLLVSATVVVFAAGCQTPAGGLSKSVPGIDPNDVDLTRELLQLDAEILDLDQLLGRYPARFRSDRERLVVHTRWTAAVEKSTVLLNVDLGNPELFARAGNLFRHGHNLGVPEASAAAYRALSLCIELAADHIDCHYRLAQLLLTSQPRFAPTAERLLLRARSLISPQTRPEFEAELARAYFAQGRRSEALRQIDYYLTLRPNDDDAQRFRNVLTGRQRDGMGSRGPMR